MTDSPFLAEMPRVVHRFWWTVLPAIPSSSRSRAYHALRRVWFDHTSLWPTTLTKAWSGPPVPRFFVEGLEDQLTPALFQTWAAFTGPDSASLVLRVLGCPVIGSVRSMAWSYRFEERLQPKKWSAIADIVLHWRDDGGQAIAVIEAKRRGGSISDKDINGNSYISLPSIESVTDRVHYALLLDARDVDRQRKRFATLPYIATWQDMLSSQLQGLRELRLSGEVAELLEGGIVARSAHLDFAPSCGTVAKVDVLAAAEGTPSRYDVLSGQASLPAVRELLVGLDVALTAQQGRMPAPPYAWLLDEPDSLKIQLEKKQSESDWARPVWNLDWQPD